MEEFDLMLVQALEKYFKVLSKKGSVDKSNTYKLIAVCAIIHILENFPEIFIEDDIREAVKALYYMAGSCLIDFPVNLTEDSMIHKYINSYVLRIAEDNSLRSTKDIAFRIKV